MNMKKINNNVGHQSRKKTGNFKKKFLPLLTILSIVIGLQVATQLFAYKFKYHQILGVNYDGIYRPWAIIDWAIKWYAQYSNIFYQCAGVGVFVTTICLIAIAILAILKSNSSKANENLHGSARWANKDDIIAAGLLPRKRTFLDVIKGEKARTSEGVYVGGWEDKKGVFHYLRHNGPEHVLTYAPTRSGKGVGLVIPTLLSWPESAFITDLKGELWALTAGWRKKYAKNKVLRFEPASASKSICWNPLDEIRIGTEYEVGDAQNLANLIVDPEGKGLKDHWCKTAFALLTGVILHAIYKGKNEGFTASLPSVDRMLADPSRNISELWNEMITYEHCDGKNHPLISSSAQDMIDRPEEEAGSVLSTAKSFLSLYRDPVVAKNVSKSNFSIKDLMNNESPVSVYVITQPADKLRLVPLVRIFTSMVVRLLADEMEFERINKNMPWYKKLLSRFGFKQVNESYVRSKKNYKHRLLGMIDEFPSLGKLDIIQESLAFIAGYGIKLYLICQDINQLKKRDTGYGADETITSNCHVQNAYPPNRIETAEHLSKLTGVTTVVKEQVTTSGKRVSALLGQVSKTIQEVQRPLLTADECMRMPSPIKNSSDLIEAPGDMVIYVAGFPAIYGKQPLFFKDPIFSARAAVDEPEVSDVIRNTDTEEDNITL